MSATLGLHLHILHPVPNSQSLPASALRQPVDIKEWRAFGRKTCCLPVIAGTPDRLSAFLLLLFAADTHSFCLDSAYTYNLGPPTSLSLSLLSLSLFLSLTYSQHWKGGCVRVCACLRARACVQNREGKRLGQWREVSFIFIIPKVYLILLFLHVSPDKSLFSLSLSAPCLYQISYLPSFSGLTRVNEHGDTRIPILTTVLNSFKQYHTNN